MALARTISPLKLSSPSFQFVNQTHVPPNSTTNRPVGIFTNLILLSTFPLLILMHSTSTRLPTSSSLFLVEAAKASIPFDRLGRSPQSLVVPGSGICSSGTTEACSVAHRSESHRLRYIDASRRASSVISRAKSATWQATCSNLSFRSDRRAVFRLLNAISGKKNTSQDSSFPIALALLTLPTTLPLIFAHVYLKRHPVPRAELNDSS